MSESTSFWYMFLGILLIVGGVKTVSFFSKKLMEDFRRMRDSE